MMTAATAVIVGVGAPPAVVVTAAATAVAAAASGLIPHATGDVLDRDDGLVELAPVGRLLGCLGLLGVGELNEGVVALHVDPDQLAVGLEEHLQILALGGLLVEVHDEQCLGGLDLLAPLILLALCASVTAGELAAEGGGDTGDRAVKY